MAWKTAGRAAGRARGGEEEKIPSTAASGPVAPDQGPGSPRAVPVPLSRCNLRGVVSPLTLGGSELSALASPLLRPLDPCGVDVVPACSDAWTTSTPQGSRGRRSGD